MFPQPLVVPFLRSSSPRGRGCPFVQQVSCESYYESRAALVVGPECLSVSPLDARFSEEQYLTGLYWRPHDSDSDGVAGWIMPGTLKEIQ